MGRRAFLSDHRFDRLVAVALTLGLFGVQWYRFTTFRFTTYDLGVFENVVWKMANGHGATTALTSWNTFADHLSPVMVVFIPLYWIASTPMWFFAAQAVGLGAAVLFIRPLTEAVGVKTASVATLLVTAYAIQPAVWNAAINAFHPTTMAVPFLFLGCIAGLRQNNRVLWMSFLVMVFLRDDLALAAVPFALVGWRAADSYGRRSRVLLIASAFGWTVIGSKIGEAMGASRHFVYRYGYLGDSMTEAATHPIRTVVGLAQHFATWETVLFAMALVVPLALLPVARPAWFAMAAFVALPSLVADDRYLHSPAFHYGAPIAPFLILAAAGALAKANEAHVRRFVVAVLPMSMAGLVLVGPALTGLFRPMAFTPEDARAAIATIKPEDRVVAADNLGAYVAERDVLKPYPWPFVDRKANFPLDPDVTDHSVEVQEQVDVVIMAKKANSPSVRAKLLNAPEIKEHFVEEDFGTVVVLRRVTP